MRLCFPTRAVPILLIILLPSIRSAPADARTFTTSKIVLTGETSPTGQPYRGFEGVSVSDDGKIAWGAYVGPLPAGVNNALFLADGSGVSIVALAGTAAPGTGGNFQSFHDPSLNNAGEIAFRAPVSGGSKDQGLFLSSGGVTTALSLEGDPAPGTGSASFTDFGPPDLNEAGDIAFNAGTDAFPPAPAAPPTGIFEATQGAILHVAAQGDIAPGTGGTYLILGLHCAINDSGSIAYLGDIYGGNVSQGIFFRAGGTISPLVLEGDPAPGTGGVFAGLWDPSSNNAGQAAFNAGVSGGSASGGIFVASSSEGHPVALVGQTAPGTGGQAYVLFSRYTVIDDAGDVAFQASYSTSYSLGGIFFYDARTGQIFPVALVGGEAPGMGGRTFSAFGYVMDINASGQVAFVAGLSDGSSGVFLATPDAPPDSVPTLSGWSAAALVILLLVYGARRARQAA